MEEIVTPAATEADAAAHWLPLEAVLQVEPVVRREPPERIDVLEPEHPLLELAWFVRLQRLRAVRALLLEECFTGLLRVKRRLREHARQHDHSRIHRHDIDPERYA